MSNGAKKFIIFLLVGILALGLGIFCLVSDKKAEKTNTGEAQAIVVDIRVDEDIEGEDDYYPIVEYDVKGKTYTVENQNSYGADDFTLGQLVDIHYNPDNPQKFTIDGENRGKQAAMFLIPIGIVLLILSLGKLVALAIITRKQN